MRKMRELFKQNERVWFWVTEEWKEEFHKELVEFGAKYNNGTNVTLESLGDIVGVWRDGTVGLVSYFVWEKSFESSALQVLRVDYGRYKRGEAEYLILTSNVKLVNTEIVKVIEYSKEQHKVIFEKSH